MGRLADDWDLGRIQERDVFTAIAEWTSMPLDGVERHAAYCCRSLVFNRAAWRVTVEHRLPQALVTVNPDLFLKRIVPEYGLEKIFDVIVASCAEGTTDKVQLCERALDRLGFRGHRRNTLLIDNRQDLVHAWEASGGTGYWYRDDATFEADLPELTR
jgi:phosphoglycolate phosphatase-like HAD superfamily hydrolase